MKIYGIDKNSDFYKGSGEAIGVLIDNKMLCAFYFNDEKIVEKLAYFLVSDLGQTFVPGMISNYEFCAIDENISCKKEATTALGIYKKFLNIMNALDNYVRSAK